MSIAPIPRLDELRVPPRKRAAVAQVGEQAHAGDERVGDHLEKAEREAKERALA